MPEFVKKMKKLEPMYNFVYKLFLVICKLLLIADICITGYIVLARYCPFVPAPNWGEEIILSLMAYMAVLSAALAIRRNAHIRMTAFDRKLGRKVVNVLDLVADIAVMILALVMLIVGLQYSIQVGAKGTYISMTWLSKFWMYFPVPLAGIAMIFFELERIIIDIEHFLGVYGQIGVDTEAEEMKREKKRQQRRQDNGG